MNDKPHRQPISPQSPRPGQHGDLWHREHPEVKCLSEENCYSTPQFMIYGGPNNLVGLDLSRQLIHLPSCRSQSHLPGPYFVWQNTLAVLRSYYWCNQALSSTKSWCVSGPSLCLYHIPISNVAVHYFLWLFKIRLKKYNKGDMCLHDNLCNFFILFLWSCN